MEDLKKSLDLIAKYTTEAIRGFKREVLISSCCGKSVHNEMCIDCGEHCGEVTESEYYE